MADSLSRQEANAANMILQQHIYKTYENQAFPQEWRNLPEVPSKAEICPPNKSLLDTADADQEDNWDRYQKEPLYDQNLPRNIVDGPWPSKEAYLGAHYQILREDAIAPLRRAVSEFKKCPLLVDDTDICVYKDATIKGLMLSKTGVGWRVEFSPQKQVKWKQSKRLLQGTMVALSSDMFKTECKIATVVGRGLSLLHQNPPAIELFWEDPEDAVIDQVQKYVMIEAREGYFEATRHMLVAMQKLMTENFQLQNHIVRLDRGIKAPPYIEDQPFMDLSSLEQKDDNPAVSQADPDRYINIDVLRNFPQNMNSGMDKSQMSACEKMLTSRIAIVQGPPGTGKTFTSVSALRVMIEDMGPKPSAILVAAQTNHALDQLLNHVLTFEPNILRLGGRSNKANKPILERTLFNLRQANRIPGLCIGYRQAHIQQANCIAAIKTAIETLMTENLLTADILRKNGLISESQRNSLYGNSDWEGEDTNGDTAEWLTEEQLMPVPETAPINLGLAMEQADIEYEEQVEDIDNEFKTDAADEENKLDDNEGLKGEWLAFKRKFTGRHSYLQTLTDKKIKSKLSSWKNLYDVPLAHRGEVYRYLEKEMNKLALKELKIRMKEYKQFVQGWAVTKHMSNIRLVRHLGIKVIGCTTTGLSKYRSLLSALNPRVLLIEEAAETLEGNVIGGLLESIEHLILVGDHQQLQASCTVRALENAPYHMNISMFERLVNNSIGYVMLNVQRRMIQDVRRLLCIDPVPFYTNLQDHPSVLDRLQNRPPVPGMGGLDTYWFHHTFHEATNAERSRYNEGEARMIARFFYYLCQNGVEASKITVLTFYNGQKSTVIQELNALGVLNDVRPFNVFTVDSYQGEENDIILLSLVRSNRDLSIGFLDSKNRLVVALSRARRGLYVFGNAATLGPAETNEDLGHQGREPLWYPLIKEMTSQCRLDMDGGLPVTCSRHGKVTRLYEPKHFDQVFAGGCDQMCVGAILPCGHPCKSACHPLDHTKVRCKQACMRTLTCGHKCSNVCTDKCYCVACGLYDGQVRVPDYADENVDLYGNIGHSVWQDSPPKNSKERSTPQQLAGKPVSLVPASTSTFNGSDTRFDLPHGGQSFGQVSPMRSFSGPLMASSGNRISPSKGGDLHLSTPSKPRPGTIGSCGSEISSQATVIRRPAFGASNFSPEAWQNWDAKKADEELAEKRRREEAAAPKADRSTLVFNETFIPTTFNNSGERVFVSSGSRRRVVPRSNVVSRGNIASLNAVLADSPFPRHDVDLGFQKKDQKPCENSRPHPISPTEISQAAQKKVAAASRALINVTSDFPSLAMKQTMLPAFGEDSEYTERFAEVNRSLNSMQERPNARGRDERFVSGSSSRGLTTPRGGSFRGGDLPHGYTAPRGGNFGEENSYRGRGSFRGYRPSRRGAPFRGKDSSRGVASSRGRGYVRGGSARGECHSRGGRSQSQQALPQAIGDLVGLEDDFSHTSLHEASDVVEDIVNLYGTSPLQS